MAVHPRPAFPHRHNLDGTFDSICTECFQTVAKASIEAELEAAERIHNCKGLSLAELMHGTRRVPKRF